MNENKTKIKIIYNNRQETEIEFRRDENYGKIKNKINKICSITIKDRDVEYYFMKENNERHGYYTESDHELFLEQKIFTIYINNKDPKKQTIEFKKENKESTKTKEKKEEITNQNKNKDKNHSTNTGEKNNQNETKDKKDNQNETNTEGNNQNETNAGQNNQNKTNTGQNNKNETEENNKNKIKVRFIYNSIQVIGLIIENNYEIIKKKINQICSITSNDKGIEYYFMTKDNERKEYLSENDHQLFLQQKYLIFNVKNPNKKTISFELDNSIYFYVLKTN